MTVRSFFKSADDLVERIFFKSPARLIGTLFLMFACMAIYVRYEALAYSVSRSMRCNETVLQRTRDEYQLRRHATRIEAIVYSDRLYLDYYTPNTRRACTAVYENSKLTYIYHPEPVRTTWEKDNKRSR